MGFLYINKKIIKYLSHITHKYDKDNKYDKNQT